MKIKRKKSISQKEIYRINKINFNTIKMIKINAKK